MVSKKIEELNGRHILVGFDKNKMRVFSQRFILDNE